MGRAKKMSQAAGGEATKKTKRPALDKAADLADGVSQAQADAEWKAIAEKYGRRLSKSPEHRAYKQIAKEQDDALERWRKQYAAPPEPIGARAELLAEIDLRLDVAQRARRAYAQGTEAEDAEPILNFALEVAANLEGPDLPVAEGHVIRDLNRLRRWCKAEHGGQGEPSGAVEAMLLAAITPTPANAADLCGKADVKHNSHAKGALAGLVKQGRCKVKPGPRGGYYIATSG